MVNFEELNKMINEINNVIADVNKDTVSIKAKIRNIKEEIYNHAMEDIVMYCKMLSNAVKKSELNTNYEIPLENFSLYFSRTDLCRDTWSTYGASIIFITENLEEKVYQIVDNRGGYINDKTYDNINHSHPSIKAFEKFILDWDNNKEIIETEIVNAVHNILKQRSEIAHNNNKKALEEYNSIS